MSKKIVRYLLEGQGSVPSFIENGGYFPVGSEIIGLSVDSTKRHVPTSLLELSNRAALVAWIISSGVSEENSEAVTDSFLASIGHAYV